MDNLIARVEAGTAEQQRELLIEAAFEIANGWWSEERDAKFYAMLDAEAYESAALMLVPEGWVSGFEHWPDPKGETCKAWLKQTSTSKIGHEYFWGHATGDLHIDGKAATPALAIGAAALRAKEADRG